MGSLNNIVNIFRAIGVGGTPPASVGAGITFPAVQIPSSDPNTFDDCERGIWTGVATGSVSGTRNSIGGVYIKLTQLAIVKASWAIVPGELSGTITIAGLPFISSATASSGTTCSLQTDRVTATGTGKFYALLGVSSSTLTLWEEKSNATGVAITSGANLLNGSNMGLQLTMIYTTAS